MTDDMFEYGSYTNTLPQTQCRVCGALVLDRDKHREWHDRLNEHRHSDYRYGHTDLATDPANG